MKIRSLGCFPEVDVMVRGGHSLESVAMYIRDDCKECTDVKLSTVISMVDVYRKSLSDMEIIGDKIPSVIIEAQSRLRSGLNAKDEMEGLFEWQKSRIKDHIDLEKKIGFQNPKIAGEMKVAMDLLVRIDVMGQRISANSSTDGTSTTIRPELSRYVGHRYGDDARAALLNPQSRARVAAIVEKISSLAVSVVEVEAEVKESSGE